MKFFLPLLIFLPAVFTQGRPPKVREDSAKKECLNDRTGRVSNTTYSITDSDIRYWCCECPPGTFLQANCSANYPTETQCRRCPVGTYASESNHDNVCSKSLSCSHQPYTRFVKGNAYEDNRCVCVDGTFSPDPKVSGCKKHLQCPQGFGVKTFGNSVNDTTCERCEEGMCSDEESSTQRCKKCNNTGMMTNAVTTTEGIVDMTMKPTLVPDENSGTGVLVGVFFGVYFAGIITAVIIFLLCERCGKKRKGTCGPPEDAAMKRKKKHSREPLIKKRESRDKKGDPEPSREEGRSPEYIPLVPIKPNENVKVDENHVGAESFQHLAKKSCGEKGDPEPSREEGRSPENIPLVAVIPNENVDVDDNHVGVESFHNENEEQKKVCGVERNVEQHGESISEDKLTLHEEQPADAKALPDETKESDPKSKTAVLTEKEYHKIFADLGYRISYDPDKKGNCLFASIFHQKERQRQPNASIPRNEVEAKAEEVRRDCVEYQRANLDEFEHFYVGQNETYLQRMSRSGEYGGHPELHAAHKRYHIHFKIIQTSKTEFYVPEKPLLLGHVTEDHGRHYVCLEELAPNEASSTNVPVCDNRLEADAQTQIAASSNLSQNGQ